MKTSALGGRQTHYLKGTAGIESHKRTELLQRDVQHALCMGEPAILCTMRASRRTWGHSHELSSPVAGTCPKPPGEFEQRPTTSAKNHGMVPPGALRLCHKSLTHKLWKPRAMP